MCTIFEAWENFQTTKDLKNDSMKREEKRFYKHLAPFWAQTKLEDIKTKDIYVFRKKLFESNLSPQSVKLCLALLRRILNRARQFELYIESKKIYFEMPVCDNQRYRFLTEAEAKELFEVLYFKSELWHDIAVFALNTGMRAGEIFSLQNSSINFEQKNLRVIAPKNGKSRIVPLNADSLSIVYRYAQKNLSYTFSDVKIKEVSHYFRNAVKATSINQGITDTYYKFVFHSLRHTFASWLVQQGTPILVVSNLLGHKNLQMTMRYAHLAPDQGSNAVATLEQKKVAFFLPSIKSLC